MLVVVPMLNILLERIPNHHLLGRLSVLRTACFTTILAISSSVHAQQLNSEARFRPLVFHIGPIHSSSFGVSAGLDYTAPKSGIDRGFATRVTLECGILIRENGLLPVDLLGNLTHDQVYQKPSSLKSPYIGFGLGIYSGPFGAQRSGSGLFTSDSSESSTKFGGELFFGSDLSSTTSVEATVHFAGDSALGSLQLGLKF